MSLGFSVGDFIAVGNLIAKSIDILRNTQSEYQELIRELENLNRALKQVDKLKSHGDQADAIDEIKCAALTCRYPIEQFLFKIQKYEKSLGLGKSVNKFKEVGRKVQYAFERKDEANRLRHYLNLHMGIINTLMLQNSLERLDVASGQSRETKDRIESYSRELKEVDGNVEAQILAVRENNSVIYKLFGMVSGEIAAPLKTLSQTMAKVSASTHQICAIMLELKTNLLGIDTRFTYFQAPVKVEDALGRMFPFASECSIEALNTEIRSRFKKGPGKMEVMAGDFELFNAKNAKQVLTISDNNGLLPGMSINMAIVLEKEFAEGECPMPHCISKTFVEAVGGGKTCSECDVWVDKATQKRKRGLEPDERLKHVETLAYPHHSEAERRMIEEELAMIEHSDSEETSITAFKRIKCGHWASDMSWRQEQSYEATEDDSMSKEREAWPLDQTIPWSEYYSTQLQLQRVSQQRKSGMVKSSYWSIREQCDFHNYLRYFGTDWRSIAHAMKTKTPVMVKNFYSRKIHKGEFGKLLKEEAARADKMRAEGADMGPMPAPTPIPHNRIDDTRTAFREAL